MLRSALCCMRVILLPRTPARPARRLLRHAIALHNSAGEMREVLRCCGEEAPPAIRGDASERQAALCADGEMVAARR